MRHIMRLVIKSLACTYYCATTNDDVHILETYGFIFVIDFTCHPPPQFLHAVLFGSLNNDAGSSADDLALSQLLGESVGQQQDVFLLMARLCLSYCKMSLAQGTVFFH